MKVIVNTTPPTNTGGVANHYKGLKKYWTENVYYNYIGGRKGIPGNIIIIYDVIKFIAKLITINPDVILLNPSLRGSAIKRDRLFLILSKLFRKPTIVFFHGWDDSQAKKISNSPYSFIKWLNKADRIFVLASSFRKQLIDWGITIPIELTTTKVDDIIVEQYDFNEKMIGKTVLFLARIEKSKGIFIVLEAFKKIQNKMPDANLIIAGSGSALEEAKEYVRMEKFRNVKFLGYVSGEELKEAYKSSDIYLLPTYAEGMPTSVLEAMALGLPIISRPVGGMVDFFENGKMGYLLDSYHPDDFAEKSVEILSSEKSLKEIGQYNFLYAKEHFYASHVARRLEELFKSVLDNDK